MDQDKIIEAADKTFKTLNQMSDEELFAKLDEYKDGPIGKAFWNDDWIPDLTDMTTEERRVAVIRGATLFALELVKDAERLIKVITAKHEEAAKEHR